MCYKTILTDQNLLERIEYTDDSFPIALSENDFDDFFHEEFNCHWHDEFEFALVLRGEAEYCIYQDEKNISRRVLKAGEGLFINTKVCHSAKQIQPGSASFDCVFPASFFSSTHLKTIYQQSVLPVARASSCGLFLTPSNKMDAAILDTLREIYHLSSLSRDYELHCLELICRIWRQILKRLSETESSFQAVKEESAQVQRMRSMLSYINEHYMEPISVNDIADAAHIGRSECFRCFRGIMGKSPVEYLIQYRLTQAALLLKHTEKSISEICFSCGFRSPSYFGKLFKEKSKMSPGEYRSSFRS